MDIAEKPRSLNQIIGWSVGSCCDRSDNNCLVLEPHRYQ
jgi:hypothetical protein